MRSRYLKTLMRQEVAYFEKSNIQALPSEITEHFFIISEGVGRKVGILWASASGIVVGLIIAYYKGRVLAGYMTLYLPVFFIVVAGFGTYLSKATSKKIQQHESLGAYTEETLSSLKLIVAFGQEEETIRRYERIAS